MDVDIVNNIQADVTLVAGDTETIRLNAKDGNGETIDLSIGFTGLLGVKNKLLDTEYLIPQIPVVFQSLGRGYTLEAIISSSETVALLNYNSKARKRVSLIYDIEVTEVSSGDITTLVLGKMKINKSIAGVV